MAVDLPPETLLERAASNSQIRSSKEQVQLRHSNDVEQTSKVFMLFEYPMPVRDAPIVMMLIAS